MPPTGQRQTMLFSATFPKEIQRLAAGEQCAAGQHSSSERRTVAAQLTAAVMSQNTAVSSGHSVCLQHHALQSCIPAAVCLQQPPLCVTHIPDCCLCTLPPLHCCCCCCCRHPDFLHDYIFLTVGRVGSSTDLIAQHVEYVQQDQKRETVLDCVKMVDVSCCHCCNHCCLLAAALSLVPSSVLEGRVRAGW
jgi:hypothetical protein